MPTSQTFATILENILNRLTFELNERVSNSEFFIVESINDFPDSWTELSKEERVGLLTFFRAENYFTQEIRYNLTLRLGVPTLEGKEMLMNFYDEVRRHLNDLGFISNIYSGLEIAEVRNDIPDSADYSHYDLFVNTVWVHNRPINLNGVELVQTILAQSVEDATITKENGPATTLTAANLQDRSDTTNGLTGSLDSGENVGIILDFGSTALTVDYFLLGNFSASNTVKVELFYWSGSEYVELFEGPNSSYASGNHFFNVLSETFPKWKIVITDVSGAGATLNLSHIFIGASYQFPKSYDIRDSGIGIDSANVQITQTPDNPIGNSLVSQSNGVRKEKWEISYGLRKLWFDNMASALLSAEIDQKNFLFRDNYRDSDFHLVKLRDSTLRANQYFQDYLRVNLRIDEQ